MKTSTDHNPLAGALAGAAAGAVGVLALDLAVKWMYNRHSPGERAAEDRARPDGLDPAHSLANWAAESVGGRLTPRQPHPAGIATHIALGVAPGAVYGALRPAFGGGPLAGFLFGLGLFVVQDELLNWALGTSGPPGAYPWQAHARGVVGHVAYGMATEAALAAFDAAA